MSESVEYSAETYADLAAAFIAMNMKKDALETVGRGLVLYPRDTRLLALLAELNGADE